GRLALAVALLVPLHAGAATITVDTLDDAIAPVTDGLCSLREALANASNDTATFVDCEAGTGNDQISFEESLFPSTPPRIATIELAGELVAGLSTGTANG